MAEVLDDREMIFSFLSGTREVLLMFVENSEVLLPGFMRMYYTQAWGDVDSAFDRAIEAISNTDEDNTLDERLETVGLTGIQLRLKMAVFSHLYEMLVSEPGFIAVTTNQSTEPDISMLKKFKAWTMKRFLGVTNSILGSLSKAIPVVDIIKEYKEMAEHGYEMSNPEL